MFAEQHAAEIFDKALFGYAIARTEQIKPDDRFAHYTNIDVARKIIEACPSERSLWLRNSKYMNDFSEVEHGQRCLDEALNDWRLYGRFRRVLNAIRPGLENDIIVPLAESAAFLAERAYLMSLSLHNNEEAVSGKLSMWRAYGKSDNVCLIFNTQPFVTQQSNFELVLSPVFYGNPPEFKREFEALIQRLENCAPQLSVLDDDLVKTNIARAIDYAILSTKHKGFHEEVEWRVIHQHSGFRTDPPSSTEIINGIEQTVYHLPLRYDIYDGIWGSALEEVLDRVIIGPSIDPRRNRNTVIRLLEDAGITNAEDRVVDCGIPLRVEKSSS